MRYGFAPQKLSGVKKKKKNLVKVSMEENATLKVLFSTYSLSLRAYS